MVVPRLGERLLFIVPGAVFDVRGDDYDLLNWIAPGRAPTLVAVQAVTDAELDDRLRDIREAKLVRITDTTSVMDATADRLGIARATFRDEVGAILRTKPVR